MAESPQPFAPPPPEMFAHYDAGVEQTRLTQDTGLLEFARTCEIIGRFFPPAPAVVLDVGGGPGAYACWLARLGYKVHLLDALPLHVAQARDAAARQPDHPLASAAVGDARRLDHPDASVDAVLLLGPLYHLIDRSERLLALREARRVLRPGGVLLAAAISRFASTLDGLKGALFDDSRFASIAERDLRDGQHRNPTSNLAYFTTTFFHHPRELRAEVHEAGLAHEATLGVEGPGWLLQDFPVRWANQAWRERLLAVARALEAEEALLGVSAHLLAVARRPTGSA